MSFFLETKQHTEATTIKNLRLETGWKFTALLIKETECIAAFGAFGGQVFFLSHSFFKKSLNKMNT